MDDDLLREQEEFLRTYNQSRPGGALSSSSSSNDQRLPSGVRLVRPGQAQGQRNPIASARGRRQSDDVDQDGGVSGSGSNDQQMKKEGTLAVASSGKIEKKGSTRTVSEAIKRADPELQRIDDARRVHEQNFRVGTGDQFPRVLSSSRTSRHVVDSNRHDTGRGRAGVHDGVELAHDASKDSDAGVETGTRGRTVELQKKNYVEDVGIKTARTTDDDGPSCKSASTSTSRGNKTPLPETGTVLGEIVERVLDAERSPEKSTRFGGCGSGTLDAMNNFLSSVTSRAAGPLRTKMKRGSLFAQMRQINTQAEEDVDTVVSCVATTSSTTNTDTGATTELPSKMSSTSQPSCSKPPPPSLMSKSRLSPIDENSELDKDPAGAVSSALEKNEAEHLEKIAAEASKRLDGMSHEEIIASVAEINSTLSQSQVEFLRKRGKAKKLQDEKNQGVDNAENGGSAGRGRVDLNRAVQEGKVTNQDGGSRSLSSSKRGRTSIFKKQRNVITTSAAAQSADEDAATPHLTTTRPSAPAQEDVEKRGFGAFFDHAPNIVEKEPAGETQLVVDVEDCMQRLAKAKHKALVSKVDHNDKNTLEDSSENRPARTPQLQEQHPLPPLRFSKNEFKKLEWTEPVVDPAPLEDMSKMKTNARDDVRSSGPRPRGGLILDNFRFDTEGKVVEESQLGDTYQPHLYHHGKEPHRAGYTFEELLRLAQSGSTPQKTMALAILAAAVDQIWLLEGRLAGVEQPQAKNFYPCSSADESLAEVFDQLQDVPSLMLPHLLDPDANVRWHALLVLKNFVAGGYDRTDFSQDVDGATASFFYANPKCVTWLDICEELLGVDAVPGPAAFRPRPQGPADVLHGLLEQQKRVSTRKIHVAAKQGDVDLGGGLDEVEQPSNKAAAASASTQAADDREDDENTKSTAATSLDMKKKIDLSLDVIGILSQIREMCLKFAPLQQEHDAENYEREDGVNKSSSQKYVSHRVDDDFIPSTDQLVFQQPVSERLLVVKLLTALMPYLRVDDCLERGEGGSSEGHISLQIIAHLASLSGLNHWMSLLFESSQQAAQQGRRSTTTGENDPDENNNYAGANFKNHHRQVVDETLQLQGLRAAILRLIRVSSQIGGPLVTRFWFQMYAGRITLAARAAVLRYLTPKMDHSAVSGAEKTRIDEDPCFLIEGCIEGVRLWTLWVRHGLGVDQDMAVFSVYLREMLVRGFQHNSTNDDDDPDFSDNNAATGAPIEEQAAESFDVAKNKRTQKWVLLQQGLCALVLRFLTELLVQRGKLGGDEMHEKPSPDAATAAKQREEAEELYDYELSSLVRGGGHWFFACPDFFNFSTLFRTGDQVDPVIFYQLQALQREMREQFPDVPTSDPLPAAQSLVRRIVKTSSTKKSSSGEGTSKGGFDLRAALSRLSLRGPVDPHVVTALETAHNTGYFCVSRIVNTAFPTLFFPVWNSGVQKTLESLVKGQVWTSSMRYQTSRENARNDYPWKMRTVPSVVACYPPVDQCRLPPECEQKKQELPFTIVPEDAVLGYFHLAGGSTAQLSSTSSQDVDGSSSCPARPLRKSFFTTPPGGRESARTPTSPSPSVAQDHLPIMHLRHFVRTHAGSKDPVRENEGCVGGGLLSDHTISVAQIEFDSDQPESLVLDLVRSSNGQLRSGAAGIFEMIASCDDPVVVARLLLQWWPPPPGVAPTDDCSPKTRRNDGSCATSCVLSLESTRWTATKTVSVAFRFACLAMALCRHFDSRLNVPADISTHVAHRHLQAALCSSSSTEERAEPTSGSSTAVEQATSTAPLMSSPTDLPQLLLKVHARLLLGTSWTKTPDNSVADLLQQVCEDLCSLYLSYGDFIPVLKAFLQILRAAAWAPKSCLNTIEETGAADLLNRGAGAA
ncbi:unnamed protein product [Amoebophrya sp. A120]|nr:unnamed protein product [Amoebophrya sp. A120]|eukprot:GSA120T00001404001.1